MKVQILRLRGVVNLEDALKIKQLLVEYLKGGLVHVVLNLDNVTHISLSAMPRLVERAERMRGYGGDVKLCGLSSYVHHLMDIAGVAKHFDICIDEAYATDRFEHAAKLRKKA